MVASDGRLAWVACSPACHQQAAWAAGQFPVDDALDSGMHNGVGDHMGEAQSPH